LSMPEVP